MSIKTDAPLDAPALVLGPIGAEGAVERIVRRIGEAIGAGLLAPGERLPAESDLAAQLDVAPMTLRQALGDPPRGRVHRDAAWPQRRIVRPSRRTRPRPRAGRRATERLRAARPHRLAQGRVGRGRRARRGAGASRRRSQARRTRGHGRGGGRRPGGVSSRRRASARGDRRGSARPASGRRRDGAAGGGRRAARLRTGAAGCPARVAGRDTRRSSGRSRPATRMPRERR